MGKLMQIIAAPFALRTLKAAREMLENVTPFKGDCGRLCGSACCRPDETGENGMLLLPFEERFYQKPIEGFPFRLAEDDRLFKGGKRLICEGTCPREHRPIACRIFPLRIRIDTDNENQAVTITAEIDPRSWVVCPLPEEGGLRAMRKDFIKAVEDAGGLLCGNVYMLEALLNEQQMIDEMRRL